MNDHTETSTVQNSDFARGAGPRCHVGVDAGALLRRLCVVVAARCVRWGCYSTGGFTVPLSSALSLSASNWRRIPHAFHNIPAIPSCHHHSTIVSAQRCCPIHRIAACSGAESLRLKRFHSATPRCRCRCRCGTQTEHVRVRARNCCRVPVLPPCSGTAWLWIGPRREFCTSSWRNRLEPVQ